MRISEALNLKLKGFEAKGLDGTATLRFLDGKNKSERQIPISKSLAAELKEYLKFRKIVLRGKEPGFFFVSFAGHKITQAAVRDWHKACLREANIPYVPSNGPRLHDMRHTFAINSLKKTAKNGRKFGTVLLALKTYMGHRSLESTEYYLRMTSEHIPNLRRKITAFSEHVFPKVIPYAQAD